MPRWLIWSPVAVLVALSALFGWRQGWIVANVTETEVIAAYAQRYLEDRASAGTSEGAVVTDCRSVPSPDARVWLVVICGPEPHDAARHYTYHVDRAGRLLRRVGPEGGDGQ